MCNDRTFCVGRLRGHGVAGRYIVVLGHRCRLSGQPRDGFAALTVVPRLTTRWGVSLVSGALASGCTKVIRVVVLYCELPELLVCL